MTYILLYKIRDKIKCASRENTNKKTLTFTPFLKWLALQSLSIWFLIFLKKIRLLKGYNLKSEVDTDFYCFVFNLIIFFM